MTDQLSTLRATTVFYVPWNLSDARDDEQARLLEKMAAFVEHKRKTQPVKIRLERQQCLFIDNRRMLHGRGLLAEDSKRHLVRFYIRTPAFSEPVSGI